MLEKLSLVSLMSTGSCSTVLILLSDAQESLMKARDERVGLMNEVTLLKLRSEFD